MDQAVFQELVSQALDNIPDDLLSCMENVEIVVEEWPTHEHLGGYTIGESDYLLGLYEGIPLTERSDYGMVLPDKITLFKGAIEAICSSNYEVTQEIRRTVIHEVAHHFGVGDERLRELGI